MTLTENITGAQHIGIPTADMEGTVRFYERLGFAVTLRAGTPDAPVAFLTQRDLTIETYQSAQTAGKPGAIDHVALDVRDVDAALASVRALGYEPLEGGVRALPFGRGVRFFNIVGPNGEKVEFNQKL